MEQIRVIGDPILHNTSEKVTVINDAIKSCIKRLKKVMMQSKGVGIAAPQIGINKRIIIFGFEDNSRYPEQKPLPIRALINPEFEPLSDKVPGMEGCLSIPNFRGSVERYHKIKYSGLDEHGKKVNAIAEGFEARIIQHEIDHLNGVLVN